MVTVRRSGNDCSVSSPAAPATSNSIMALNQAGGIGVSPRLTRTKR